MLDKTSEKNIIGGREAQQSGVNIIDFDSSAACARLHKQLADKLGAQLGEELGRGAMGIVYEMRAESAAKAPI